MRTLIRDTAALIAIGAFIAMVAVWSEALRAIA